jgi:hypothetical protein
MQRMFHPATPARVPDAKDSHSRGRNAVWMLALLACVAFWAAIGYLIAY